MKNIIVTFLFLALISCSAPEATGPVFIQNGLALDGYDPVAYFEQSEAKKGHENEVVTYQGATYAFSSTKNRQLFEQDPDKYLPAYGGWCAYAVAETSTRMSPDPTQWQIQDGQLQLFYDDWQTSLFGSLKSSWNEDPTDYKSRADQNWEQMKWYFPTVKFSIGPFRTTLSSDHYR